MRLSKKIRNKTADLISQPPRLTCSQWADEFAYIPPEGNSESGKYRLRRMPHQIEMLDDYHEPGVREFYHQMASQYAGKTLCMIIDCGYIIDQLRQNILCVRGTVDTATEWMRDKFLPFVRATPRLKGLLKDPRKRDSESTSLNRKFPGGNIKVIGANSVSSFRGSSAPHIRADEIDAYETTKEGDPIALADRAGKTFSNTTKGRISTPTLAGFSRINHGFKSGDMQYFNLPCPCCGEYQWLKTEQMKFSFTSEESIRLSFPDYHPNNFTWEIGSFSIKNTEQTIYICEHCKRGWTDQQRLDSYFSRHADNPSIVVNGIELRSKWIATAPFKGVRSRHLSGMYASIGLETSYKNYLHMFAEKFLEAVKGGRETLMAWTNMFKNEPFEDEAEKVDWTQLKERTEDYGPESPLQCVLFSGAMDVQGDRVEILSVGWGDGQECWVMDYKVIYGDFDMPEMQERVADYLINKRFSHKIIGEVPYEFVAVDSGHQTKVKAVFRFCRKHILRNFWAVKGFDNTLGSIFSTRKEQAFKINVFNLNVDYLKTVVYESLKNTEAGSNYIHFPKRPEFNEKFFVGVCSEKRFAERKPNGGFIFKWKKFGEGSKANEPLDLLVYNHGGYEILRKAGKVEWIARKWKEVSAKITGDEPILANAPKEYILIPPIESKQPELKKELSTRKPSEIKKTMRRPFGHKRADGLRYNPYNL